MSMRDGGPAFPTVEFIEPNGDRIWPERGMSLRDYAVIKFAAAMASIAVWPSDKDWPEIIRRANVGADEFIAERDK
jgi:hypothetical protein